MDGMIVTVLRQVSRKLEDSRMNRTLIVGIALIGGSNTAMAGHGCCGCHASCDCGGCGGGGCCGCHHRHHRHRCCGCDGCCGCSGESACAAAAPSCCGA